MLADLFDVIPLDQCEDMFNLVEDRVSIMKSVGIQLEHVHYVGYNMTKKRIGM